MSDDTKTTEPAPSALDAALEAFSKAHDEAKLAAASAKTVSTATGTEISESLVLQIERVTIEIRQWMINVFHWAERA